MLFCGMCGAHLRQHCPQCHFANPLNYQFCGMCGTVLTPLSPPLLPSIRPESPQIQAPLAGERRSVTVILNDVVGSTELLQQLGSESWVEIMNQALQLLEAEVYRYGGEVDQFRGDGLVAFFGTKTANEDDPERAILAGLAMQESLKMYAQKLAEEQDIH
jgi:class 3 adenylate cyclase